jgi:hypothetical protein
MTELHKKKLGKIKLGLSVELEPERHGEHTPLTTGRPWAPVPPITKISFISSDVVFTSDLRWISADCRWA